MICKRCKREFTQKNEEVRCSRCLTKRRENRIAKKKTAIQEVKVRTSIDSMMRRNGDNKRGSTHVSLLK